MPYPRKVTADQRAMLRQVALTRRQCAEVYKTLPSNKQLAAELGVSRGCVEQILVQELATHDAQAVAGANGAGVSAASSVQP